MEKDVTLLPQPLSPTTPTILFLGMSNDTPLTDMTVPTSVKKHVLSPSISIMLFSSRMVAVYSETSRFLRFNAS